MAPSGRILGLDPGTRFLGWGVVETVDGRPRAVAHGVVRANARDPLPRRLAVLARGLREVVEQHAPAEAAIEEAFHGRSAQAALRLGEGRGVALLVAAEGGLEIAGYANNVVKRAVAGAGRASKERVQVMVVRLLGLKEEPETLDASDALALALCHHQRRALAGLGGGEGGLPPRVREAIKRADARGKGR